VTSIMAGDNDCNMKSWRMLVLFIAHCGMIFAGAAATRRRDISSSATQTCAMALNAHVM